ncbi:MAG TPA: methylthioribulose 1-phosphate dehydratase [Candidatus Baltobacteraceae bacterium]|nr:methylthioribulose 1-phosphate dehydratase [Candidatus Baltobacteraceae bacterium]
MLQTTIPDTLAGDLAAIGRFAASRGWVPATSGNFSRRIDGRTIAITRSGIDKGTIGAADLIAVDLEAPLPPGVSAETPLHVARYRNDPGVGAIAHVHSVAATVLSRADQARGYVQVDGFEMQKSIGLTTHESTVRLPIFANDQDTQALARRIEAALGATPPVPGYLLAGHGLYAWGATMDETRRHLDGLEFLLACSLEERRIRR